MASDKINPAWGSRPTPGTLLRVSHKELREMLPWRPWWRRFSDVRVVLLCLLIPTLVAAVCLPSTSPWLDLVIVLEFVLVVATTAVAVSKRPCRACGRWVQHTLTCEGDTWAR